MYWEPGVVGVLLGSRPRSLRWEGVRGISERSSLRRKRGYRAIRALESRMRRSARRV